MKQPNRIFNFVFACFLALGVLGGQAGQSALGSVFPIGDANGWSVLATDGSVSSSDTAFQGNVGIASSAGSFTQSGGGATNTQIPINVYLATGATFNQGTSNETVVPNSDALLSQAVSQATTLSNTLAGEAPTQSALGNITSSQTITLGNGTTVGNYVLSISSINLNQGAITLDAAAGSTVVLNISGGVTMNGGSQGNGILATGGITANDVIINMTGGNFTFNTTGGGNAQHIEASILDLGGTVALHPGEVDGTIVTKDFQSSSGSLVLVPVPEANAVFVLLALIPLMILITPTRVRKFWAAFRQNEAVAAMA